MLVNTPRLQFQWNSSHLPISESWCNADHRSSPRREKLRIPCKRIFHCSSNDDFVYKQMCSFDTILSSVVSLRSLIYSKFPNRSDDEKEEVAIRLFRKCARRGAGGDVGSSGNRQQASTCQSGHTIPITFCLNSSTVASKVPTQARLLLRPCSTYSTSGPYARPTLHGPHSTLCTYILY